MGAAWRRGLDPDYRPTWFDLALLAREEQCCATQH